MLAVLAGTLGFVLSAPFAWSQELKKSCPAADVQITGLTSEPVLSSRQVGPSAAVQPGGDGGAAKVIALGPVLGAMDSPKPRIDLTCSPDGVAVQAIISRSAEFNGAVLANVNWRPRLVIAVQPRRPEADVRITWKMRLSSGAEVEEARTPGFLMQKFPVAVSVKVREKRLIP